MFCVFLVIYIILICGILITIFYHFFFVQQCIYIFVTDDWVEIVYGKEILWSLYANALLYTDYNSIMMTFKWFYYIIEKSLFILTIELNLI